MLPYGFPCFSVGCRNFNVLIFVLFSTLTARTHTPERLEKEFLPKEAFSLALSLGRGIHQRLEDFGSCFSLATTLNLLAEMHRLQVQIFLTLVLFFFSKDATKLPKLLMIKLTNDKHKSKGQPSGQRILRTLGAWLQIPSATFLFHLEKNIS
ncbi:hypothetical protein VNO77_07983 [Canavalia gladiata]|uniref:Uncharacterized protein n=1 Tax=Canavalia gladiata TaxID=3824 RepID=A0AAN9M9L4_CANGL